MAVQSTTSAEFSPITPGSLPLWEHIGTLAMARAQIGSAPPRPDTIRGRVGAVLVSVVRRMLFWFFPQLDRFHAASIAALEAQARALESLAALQRDCDAALRQLREEVAATRGDTSGTAFDREDLEALRDVLRKCQELLGRATVEAMEERIEARFQEVLRNELQACYRDWNERHARLEASWWAECLKCRAQLPPRAARKPEPSAS